MRFLLFPRCDVNKIARFTRCIMKTHSTPFLLKEIVMNDIDIETTPSTDLVALDETDTETNEDGGNTNLAYAGVAVASAALTVVTMKYVLPTVHG